MEPNAPRFESSNDRHRPGEAPPVIPVDATVERVEGVEPGGRSTGAGPGFWDGLKRYLGPVAVVLLLVFKFFAKVKFLIIPVLKFFPVILMTGGTMLLSIVGYVIAWGWQFAVGFVLLILVHELGHLAAARRLGLNVGAPVFIPFMGAFIALKEAPRNAWIEAQVGIGGPLFGALGAFACDVVYDMTGSRFFRALAYSGYFLNLFNLIPIGFLDGGRIVTALSPWLWVMGLLMIGWMVVTHYNFILLLVLILSLPRVFSLFRAKSDEERRYFEVTPGQRWFIGGLYFILIAFLVLGMGVQKDFAS
jgi:Zn-dependent protease